MRPDFLTIKRNRKILRHSAKGSTWEEHKYIKKNRWDLLLSG